MLLNTSRLRPVTSKQSDLANLAIRIGLVGAHPSSGHPDYLVEGVSTLFI